MVKIFYKLKKNYKLENKLEKKSASDVWAFFAIIFVTLCKCVK